MIPQAIGRYEILALLGEGAFGQVFAARDPALARRVAIKMLRSQFSGDDSFMKRFHGEAARLAALAHPNVTLIYDFLQNGAEHGIIMELVSGHTLELVLQQRPKLELGEALAVAVQAVAGLGYVHGKGVVHRDIKPANLMLTSSGVLKIMDFGIARAQGEQRLTREGSMVGTLIYAAPEQIKRGEGEPRSDLYSLGCVLYEMICGRPPFEGSTEYELMQAHIVEAPQPLSKWASDVPETVDRAVLRALAKDPNDRFASVEEFGQALGLDAVQSKAVGIVHEIVERAGAIPALPDNPAVSSVVSPNRPDPVRVPGPGKKKPAVANNIAAALKAGDLKDKAPILAMAAAAVVVLAVFGFILFDSGGAGDQTNNTKVAIAKTEPAKKDKPETLPKPTDKGPSEANVSETKVKPPEPKPPEPAPETPAYQGRVVDWVGGGTILVPDEGGKGVRFLQLFGVRDRMGTQQQANEIRRQLAAYLNANGRQVSCFKRGPVTQKSPEYQCFIGKQDIARWAIEQRLAQVSPDAPQEYRAASQ